MAIEVTGLMGDVYEGTLGGRSVDRHHPFVAPYQATVVQPLGSPGEVERVKGRIEVLIQYATTALAHAANGEELEQACDDVHAHLAPLSAATTWDEVADIAGEVSDIVIKARALIT